MLELRDKVFETDKTGSLQDVEASLKPAGLCNHAHEYRFNHRRNGCLSPIQLQYTYQRYATNQGTTNNDFIYPSAAVLPGPEFIVLFRT